MTSDLTNSPNVRLRNQVFHKLDPSFDQKLEKSLFAVSKVWLQQIENKS